MLEAGIKINGLSELEKNLRELGAALGARTLAGALRDAAAPIFDDMQKNAPEGDYGERVVKTKSGGKVTIRQGFLKSRVKIRSSVNRRGVGSKRFDKNTSAVVRVGVFKVPYVVPVEYGTSRTPANSFVRRAALRSDEALEIFKQRLQHRIQLAQKRLSRKR